MKYSNVIIFDTETTGTSVKKDDMIELGYVVCSCQDGKLIPEHKESLLIKIPYSVPKNVSEINHITDEMLAKDGITSQEAYKKFMQYYRKDSLLMSYNYQFDSWFLERFCELHNPSFTLTNDFICILTLVKDFVDFPTKLFNVIEKLGLDGEVVNSHRAEDDALAALYVLNKLNEIASTINKEYNLNHYLNVLGYNQKYPIKLDEKRNNATYYAQDWNHQAVLKQVLRNK